MNLNYNPWKIKFSSSSSSSSSLSLSLRNVILFIHTRFLFAGQTNLILIQQVEIMGQKNAWNDCIRLRNIQLLTSVCSPEVLSKPDMTAATSTGSLPISLTTNTSVQVKTTTVASVKTTRMKMSTTTPAKTTAETTTTITPSQEASRTTITTTTSSTVKGDAS